jgi:hypothetical protein
MASNSVVVCRNLSRVYDADAVPVRALSGVDIDVVQGDCGVWRGRRAPEIDAYESDRCADRPSGSVVDGVALNGLDEAQLADLRLTKIGFVFKPTT